MDLERLNAAIRPRNHWEAMDLGLALARRWFLPLWLLWWCTAALPGLLLLPWVSASPTVWILLLWWLKPLFEAPLLAWLARALFGECLPTAAALRRLPSSFPRRLWPYLFWRRLSPARSFTMAVTLLEGQGGRARRARLRVLLAGNTGAGLFTLLCIHVEGVLWIGALLGLLLMVPAPLAAPDLLDAVSGATPWLDWAGSLLTLLAMSLVAPFYAAGGFALYLARRTDLEAWDLELVFRRARDLARPASRKGAGATGRTAGLPLVPVLALVGVLIALAPTPGPAAGAAAAETAAPAETAGAAEAAAPAPAPGQPGLDWPIRDMTPADAGRLIDEILAAPDFGRSEERPTWVWVGPESADADDPAPPGWVLQLLLRLAQVLKWVLLIGVAVIAALLLARLVNEWRGLPARRRTAGPAVGPSVAVTVPAVSPLPADIPAAVHDLLAAGQTRAALALLYRAQIVWLRGRGLAIPDSATESDCLAAARRAANPAEGDWLGRLTALWQRLAYAHQPVSAAEVQDLLARRPRPGAAVADGAGPP